MSRFYVTLPSNSSMDYYPNITVGRFTTKLNSLIELEGDWEVGLTEISFPSFVENMVEGHCYYNININDRFLCRTTLEPKHYLRVGDVLRDLNEQQLIATSLQDRNKPPLVGFSMSSSNVKLNFYRAGDTCASVDFSNDLARLLGFEPYKRHMSDGVTGKRTPNIMPNIRPVYVYYDILEHVPVGDTKAPLLRIVDKPSSLGGNVHRILNPTLYVPLQKRCFDTVEINMMTDTGVVVPFINGKSFVVLEFRRVAHPYLPI